MCLLNRNNKGSMNTKLQHSINCCKYNKTIFFYSYTLTHSLNVHNLNPNKYHVEMPIILREIYITAVNQLITENCRKHPMLIIIMTFGEILITVARENVATGKPNSMEIKKWTTNCFLATTKLKKTF